MKKIIVAVFAALSLSACSDISEPPKETSPRAYDPQTALNQAEEVYPTEETFDENIGTDPMFSWGEERDFARTLVTFSGPKEKEGGAVVTVTAKNQHPDAIVNRIGFDTYVDGVGTYLSEDGRGVVEIDNDPGYDLAVMPGKTVTYDIFVSDIDIDTEELTAEVWVDYEGSTGVDFTLFVG